MAEIICTFHKMQTAWWDVSQKSIHRSCANAPSLSRLWPVADFPEIARGLPSFSGGACSGTSLCLGVESNGWQHRSRSFELQAKLQVQGLPDRRL